MKHLLLILTCVLTASAQQPLKPCTLTLEQSPEVRGLKLGQPFAAMEMRFPRRHPRYDRIDEAGIRQEITSAPALRNPELLKGVMLLRTVYLDDKLASIEVAYDRSVRWQSAAHFTAAIVEQLKLPNHGWRKLHPGALTLQCNGFAIETLGSSSLKVERSDFDSEVAKRRAAVEQKKRVEFKP